MMMMMIKEEKEGCRVGSEEGDREDKMVRVRKKKMMMIKRMRAWDQMKEERMEYKWQ